MVAAKDLEIIKFKSKQVEIVKALENEKSVGADKTDDDVNKLIIDEFSEIFEGHTVIEKLTKLNYMLKLIICYISSGATNIAEVSSGFHQADWSNTLDIVYCYLISFLFCFICLLLCLFLARNLIVRICRRQVNLNLRYI